MSSGLGSSSGGTGGSSGAMMSASAGGAQEPSKDVADVLEERLIDAEYKIWKKNTPYLYDFVMTHSLEWPSLTCQWLPTSKSSQGSSAVEHSLLLGTHTTGEQNYLMVASVNLPKDNAVIDQRAATAPTDAENKDPNQTTDPSTSSTSGNGKVKVAGGAVLAAANYDDEKGELGGFGTPSGGVGKIEIRMKIKHEGELNRARYMPQNHFIVATRGPNPEVYIWDLSRHPSMPADDDDSKSPFCPQGVCVGHSREGYGLCWSPHKEGLLLSGSEDRSLCLWDVSSITSSKTRTESGTQFQAITTFTGHTDVIEDVDWHKRDPNLVGSVSDDRTLRLWDIREKNTDKCVNMVKDVHDGDVNCLSFNPVNEFLVATGGADKTVALWDMRNLTSRMQTLVGHNDQVYQVEWAPHNESVLGSCSADRRVAIWDLSRIGMEQTPEDAEDGPPELLFMHGGHTSKVSDFSWNIRDEWTMASVSEDNVLQIWNMAEEIYTPEADEEEMSSGAEDDILGEDDSDNDVD